AGAVEPTIVEPTIADVAPAATAEGIAADHAPRVLVLHPDDAAVVDGVTPVDSIRERDHAVVIRPQALLRGGLLKVRAERQQQTPGGAKAHRGLEEIFQPHGAISCAKWSAPEVQASACAQTERRATRRLELVRVSYLPRRGNGPTPARKS